MKGRPPMFIGYSITAAQYSSPQPARKPDDPAHEDDLGQGRMVEVEGLRQLLDGIGRVGVDLAVARRRGPARPPPPPRRGVELGHEPVDRRPGPLHGFSSSGISAREDRPHLEDRDRGQEAHEEEEQGDEEPDGADEGRPVEPRPRVHAPGRGQEVAVQARHDDDEPLQPHPDAHHEGDAEEEGHAGAEVLDPEQVRAPPRCRRSSAQ